MRQYGGRQYYGGVDELPAFDSPYRMAYSLSLRWGASIGSVTDRLHQALPSKHQARARRGRIRIAVQRLDEMAERIEQPVDEKPEPEPVAEDGLN